MKIDGENITVINEQHDYVYLMKHMNVDGGNPKEFTVSLIISLANPFLVWHIDL